MEKHEIVIVGAGPAGLSAAVKCAKEGVKTLLIERRKIPSHKYSVVCALAGSNTLKKLYGIDASKFGGNPISNYAFFRHNYSVAGKINLNLNVKNFGIALTGKEFEEYMLGLADLNILQAIVTGCARKEGEIVLNLSNGESVKTKILIDASGPLREPSRMLGKGWNPKYSWTHMGYILEGVKPEEFGIDSETAANNFYPIDPYKQLADLVVEPLGQDKVGFTVHVLTSLRKKSIFPAEMPTGENLYSLCKNIAGETLSRIESEYREQIQKARKAHTYWGVLPHGIETPPYDDNLLIAGTAAGQGPYILDAGFLNFCLYGSMAGDVAVKAITEENYSKKLSEKI